MRTASYAAMLLATLAVPGVIHAEPAKHAATTAQKTKAAYDVQETDLGTLLDDPASKAILAKYIPEVIGNPQVEMGRGLTLSQLQQYASDQITEEKLAKIQADLTAAKP